MALLGRSLSFACLLFVLPWSGRADAIRVDITPGHSTNEIVPAQAFGAGVDRLPRGATDRLLAEDTLEQVLAAGWQTVSYRLNTELHTEAWHWNPSGTWSDPAGKGYFVGDAATGEPIRHSYAYPLPHRGVTRDDGTDTIGYSRLTDGDLDTYWKSNPYLTRQFTAEDDALHPQWVILDLGTRQDLTAIRIAWAEPYARSYVVQYWTGDEPIRRPTAGVWRAFPGGVVANAQDADGVLRLAAAPVAARYVRILMSRSSDTCDTHGAADRRNCAGYAIREIFLGTTGPDGTFHDVVRHVPDQAQTATYCSSVDPWHEAAHLDEGRGDQVGFDLFFTSGVTRGLPAMVPVALLYGTPEDAAAEIAFLEKRGYPISYVEMGEEPDGHYTPPEDYGALYVQFARALHRVDPRLKLGGPVFTGVNEDIDTWPDAEGRTSWTRRFLGYLASHGALADLAFFSFEHYPMEPGTIPWSRLYEEPDLIRQILRVWRDDGVPADVPLFCTECNIAWQSDESFVDAWGALWLADFVGSFFAAGGDALYHFHYLPTGLHRGHNGSLGTFGMFSMDGDRRIRQPLAQFFASQLVTQEWVQPGQGRHGVHPAQSDVRDGAGHVLVTAYALERPDGEWSLLVVNKDQDHQHTVGVSFHDESGGVTKTFAGGVRVTTFGKAEYQWHPDREGGVADPDGPPSRSLLHASAKTTFSLPAASIVVLRGSIEGRHPPVRGTP